MTPQEAAEFATECNDLCHQMTAPLHGHDKAVVITTATGLLASIGRAYGVPRKALIAMFNSAWKDMEPTTGNNPRKDNA